MSSVTVLSRLLFLPSEGPEKQMIYCVHFTVLGSFCASLYANVKEHGCKFRKRHRGNKDRFTLRIFNRSVARVSWESKQAPWEVPFSTRVWSFTLSSQSESWYHLQPLECTLKERLYLMVDVGMVKRYKARDSTGHEKS